MTEAQKRAKQNYQKKMNRFTIDFCPTEQALWEQIQKQPKKQTYIKMLIQRDIDEDMKKGEHPKKERGNTK